MADMLEFEFCGIPVTLTGSEIQEQSAAIRAAKEAEKAKEAKETQAAKAAQEAQDAKLAQALQDADLIQAQPADLHLRCESCGLSAMMIGPLYPVHGDNKTGHYCAQCSLGV
jgi:hypothetical protein